MDGPRRPLILLLAASCLVAALVITVLVSRDTTTTPPEQASSKTRRHPHHRAPGVRVCDGKGSRGHTLPAALLGPTASDIPTQVLIPRNAWSAADCHTETWVYAGIAGWTHAAGIFVITRTKGEYNQQPNSYIVLPGSGATRITHAPVGPKVVTTAQHHGQFKFTSKRGITGTVSLADDTATLSTGEVIHATDRPYGRS
jgi:hypothetical protein